MNRHILLLLATVVALSACTESTTATGSKVEEQDDGATESVVVAPIKEADTIDAGLAVGDTVPLSTRLQTSDGNTTFEQILADGPALVVFTRSVEWCPYCQTQLKSINSIVADLNDRGYDLYGLSYDSPDKQDRFSKNQMLRYKLLSDQQFQIIDAFGLRDPQYTEGRAVGVPYASVYIVDTNGKVVAKSVSGNYKKRPTNEQILNLLDSI